MADTEPVKKPPQKDGKNHGGEKRRKEDDSAPLVKPTPVADPDESGHQTRTAKIKEEIDAGEKKVIQINEDIEKYKEQRTAHDVFIKEVKAELMACKDRARECARERDLIMDDVKRMTESIKTQNIKVERLRKDLKLTDLDEIDQRVAELNCKLESTVMELKEEKDIVRDIKRLTADKDKVREWVKEKEVVATKKAQHDLLFASRQAKGDEWAKIRDEERAIGARLDALKAGEGTPEGINPSDRVKELLDEKAKVIESIKASRQEMKDAHGEFRQRASQYREYQRALQSYERRVERTEFAKRRDEHRQRQQQMKEERKERDKQRKENQRRQEQRMAAVAAGCQLFVGGLALKCSEVDLELYFAKFGEVTDTAVVMDNEANLSRGFGFVTFAEKSCAEAAVKACNNKEIHKLSTLHGRLKLKMAEKSKQQKEWEQKNARRLAKQKEQEEKAAAGAAGGTASEEGTAAVSEEEGVTASEEGVTASEEGFVSEEGVTASEEGFVSEEIEVPPSAEGEEGAVAASAEEDEEVVVVEKEEEVKADAEVKAEEVKEEASGLVEAAEEAKKGEEKEEEAPAVEEQEKTPAVVVSAEPEKEAADVKEPEQVVQPIAEEPKAMEVKEVAVEEQGESAEDKIEAARRARVEEEERARARTMEWARLRGEGEAMVRAAAKAAAEAKQAQKPPAETNGAKAKEEEEGGGVNGDAVATNGVMNGEAEGANGTEGEDGGEVGGKKKWKATRTEWVQKENGDNGVSEKEEEAPSAVEPLNGA